MSQSPAEQAEREPTDQERAAALLPVLAEQERSLHFTRFDEDVAWELGCRIVAAARERGLPVAVSIRLGSRRLFHAALPGTCADNDSWLDRKARVVERFGSSSYLVGRRLAAQGRTLAETYSVDDAQFAAHGGGFPVTVTGVGVVGAVVVSGLPQADDHAFVVEMLTDYLQLKAQG